VVDYSTLASLVHQKVDCVFFDSIESTNNYLLNQPFSEVTQLCIAREQTNGKGQHGRVWCSQKDGSVLFSIRQNFDVSCDLSGLSLVVALAIVKSLKEACSIEKLGIKWPNDIYFGDKKETGRYNTIATWQSINVLEKKSKTEFKEVMQNIQTIIVDEVHMAKADVKL
jgi:BirA family biotin operon repressor/biotin-[acetyl-CoA-carboxylase] ligase